MLGHSLRSHGCCQSFCRVQSVCHRRPGCSPHHTALPCRSAQSSEGWDTGSWFPCPNKRGSEHLGTKDYYLLPFIPYLHGDSARCPEPPQLCYKIVFYSKKDNTENNCHKNAGPIKSTYIFLDLFIHLTNMTGSPLSVKPYSRC